MQSPTPLPTTLDIFAQSIYTWKDHQWTDIIIINNFLLLLLQKKTIRKIPNNNLSTTNNNYYYSKIDLSLFIYLFMGTYMAQPSDRKIIIKNNNKIPRWQQLLFSPFFVVVVFFYFATTIWRLLRSETHTKGREHFLILSL